MAKAVVNCTWDDVPHLTEADKAELISSYPVNERDARTKGVPAIGAGKIYPISEEDLLVDDFQIPHYWHLAYGFDVGWNKTAAVWGAIDRDNDILYLTGEYYRGMAEPEIHVKSLKMRGEWIPGAIDPASRGRGQRDGLSLMDEYKRLGLVLHPAENAREAGIFEVFTRMSTGRLKVFKSLVSWLFEFRLYRRDDKGQVVKENDHLMDCTRYLVMTGISISRTKPGEGQQHTHTRNRNRRNG